MQLLPTSRGRLYGDLAFAVLVPAAFSQFFFVQRIPGEPWQVVVTFMLGAAYAAFGILGNDLATVRPRPRIHAYYVVQCLLAAATIQLSPMKGAFFILGLPMVSQSMFDYTWRGGAVITAWMYLVSVTVFWSRGVEVMLEASTSYLPAFLFTLVFSIITREATSAKRRAEQMSAELTAANDQLRAHAAQAEELATTRERNRLAREIHDGVGHYLTVIKVQLDAASALLPAAPARAADSVRKAARLAGEALDDVRRSVGSLAADNTRPPLTDTLRTLIADAAPVPDFQVEGAPRPLAAAAEHALYRTAQEGLTNVRKHAHATAATLTLDFREPGRVRLMLTDNGRGLSPADPWCEKSGYGLRGLRERIALLGGRVTAENRVEGGFLLSVEVPA